MISPEKGTSLDIAKIFHSYDLDGDGYVSRKDMTESLQNISSAHKIQLPSSKITAMTDAIFTTANRGEQDGELATNLTMSDWNHITKNALDRHLDDMAPQPNRTPKVLLRRVVNVLRSYRQQIFWLCIFYMFQLAVFGIGIDRYLRELPTSRHKYSAKSMVSLAFALILEVDMGILLLIPAYRWTVGHLRRTFVAKYFPFDSGITFHIFFACTVCVCAFLHVLLFLLRFYEESQHANHGKGNYTIFIRVISVSGVLGNEYLGYTAISGWVMVAALSVLAFFALPPIRNSRCYDFFYWTHKLQFVIWAALIVHAPHFWMFFLAPFTLLLLEKIHKYYNAIRWSWNSKIIEVNLLPSNVTHLVVRRPADFKYNPGDYVFLKVPRVGVLSWHPFTLSSCPEQNDVLWVHIKSSGNWTTELRAYFEQKATAVNQSGEPVTSTINVPSLSAKSPNQDKPENQLQMQPIVPTIHHISRLNTRVFLDGPYGASTTALFDTEHAVLICAGIGVTPFASVLGSVLAQYRINHTISQDNQTMRINQRQLKLKKLDFIWVSREHENIHWFVDLLHGWETQQQLMPNDSLFMDCELYITSIPRATDCEIPGLSLGMDLHRQVYKKDIVTGLRTATRTGRPDWPSVFSRIKRNKRGSVRVFYCGTHSLERELRFLAAQHKFQFSWENF